MLKSYRSTRAYLYPYRTGYIQTRAMRYIERFRSFFVRLDATCATLATLPRVVVCRHGRSFPFAASS